MTRKKKHLIPGSLWLALSFIPYIVSWAGPPFLGEISLPISTVAALGLLILRIYSKDVLELDVISFIYFLSVSIIDRILSEPFFYFETGVIGYAVLAIGTIVSILRKQPFTFLAAHRNFEIGFHYSPIFLKVNQVITLLWTVIFLASSLCYIVLGMGNAILFANLFTIVGIIASVVLPDILQKQFLRATIIKDPWKINRTNQEFDVAIAGSGIGGLTAAAKLASQGKKVIVIEKHSVPGGYCSSFKKKGYYFNSGVEDVSSVFPGGTLYELLTELGISIENLFCENRSSYHLSDGKIITEERNEVEFQKKLMEIFPHEKESLINFFNSAEAAYSQAMKGVDEYGTPLPLHVLSLFLDEKSFFEKLKTHPIENPDMQMWMSKTYEEILNSFFKDPILKEFFCVRLPFTGTKVEDTNGLLALTAIVTFNLHFGHSIKRGAQALPDAFVEYIRSHGGTVLLSTPVEQILIENGKACGLVTKDKTYRADAVISNVDAFNTFTKLIPKEAISKSYIDSICKIKMSKSCLMLSIGVNMDLNDKVALIRTTGKNRMGIHILNHAGEGFAPKDKTALCIIIPDPKDIKNYPDRKSPAYKELKERLADKIIQRAEILIPGLSQHVEVIDLATPRTFERYTGMPGGALYSFYQGKEIERPFFKTPIPGLYLVGASTFPGGGIEAVTISGIIAAMDILGWKKKSNKKEAIV